MGAPGFWDDQERAAEGGCRARSRDPQAEHVQSARERRGGSRAARGDGRGGSGDRRRARGAGAGCPGTTRRARGGAAVLRSLRRWRCARDDQRRRGRHRRAGLGRDGPADGDALGGEARLRSRAARGEPGRRGGHQVGDVHRQGRERLRPVRQREGRPPARAAVAVRRGPSPPDELRRRSRSRPSSGRSTRSKSTTTISRSTRIAPAAPAASTSTRPTPRCGSRTSRPASSSSARTSARSRRTRREAMTMLRSKLLELEERRRREEIAREKGEAQDVNFGSQIRSYVLHPYTMVKDHRTDHEMGDANRVLDGDLDGFVRAYLLKAARDERAATPPAQPTAPYLEAITAYGFRGSTRFHVPGHKGGEGADPGLRAALGERRTAARHPAGHRGDRRRPRRRPRTSAPSSSRRRPTAPSGRGSSPTARRRATMRCASRSRRPGTARRAAAQLPREPDRRLDPERRRCRRGSRPSTTPSWAWRTASRRRRCAEALASHRPAPAPPSSSRRPTTGWPPTWPRCAEVAHARRRRARRRQRLGARTSASTGGCRSRR